MCRLNKFTATLYVNENIKEQGSGGIIGSFGAQNSETITSDSETKSKYNCSGGGVPHYPEGALVGCWRQSSLTKGLHMIRLTVLLCSCHNILFQSTPDRN